MTSQRRSSALLDTFQAQHSLRESMKKSSLTDQKSQSSRGNSDAGLHEEILARINSASSLCEDEIIQNEHNKTIHELNFYYGIGIKV